MAMSDQIMQDITPGMRLSIKGMAKRHQVSYSTAQKALRELWKHKFLKRTKEGRELWYEGTQERLL